MDYISTDSLPVNRAFKGWRLFLHDFTASFFLYLKVNFVVKTKMIGSEFDIDRIEFFSNMSGYSFKGGFGLKVLNLLLIEIIV